MINKKIASDLERMTGGLGERCYSRSHQLLELELKEHIERNYRENYYDSIQNRIMLFLGTLVCLMAFFKE